MPNLFNQLLEFIIPSKARRKNGMDYSSIQATPLTEINKELRDMSLLLREVAAKHKDIEQRHKAILVHSSNAWNEREALFTNYYNTLSVVLQVLDNCESALESSPQMMVVYNGLKVILENQHIEPIPVKEGDLFDAQLHECEETAKTEDSSPCVVLQVIEKGYMQKRRDGIKAIIRPAKVCVSEKLPTLEVTKDEP